MTALLDAIRQCTRCAGNLPEGPRPVLQYQPAARILIVGQAPGRRVHETGIPFNDPSGDRLRAWMGIDRETFYDSARIAIVPMGFCYPGTGKSGDLPPRPECAATWREKILAELTAVQLTLVIGQYAMGYHLPQAGPTLTDKVRNGRQTASGLIPLPHPSPRNNLWLRRNPWFEEEVLPVLKERVAGILGDTEG